MPLLSIIVTTYNVDPFIDECLDGLVNQTLRDIELIVVDDGSTDTTLDRVERFARNDGRIRVVPLEENSIGGVATPANIGLDLAQGDFVGFADGDDIYDTTMFEKMVHAGREHDADLIVCKYLRLDQVTGELSQTRSERRWKQLSGREVLDLDERGRKMLLQFMPAPWRKVYRRDLLDRQIRFPVGDFFYEDEPFHWFVVLSARRAAFVPEHLCQHRINRPGQTTNVFDHRFLGAFRHHKIISDWLYQQNLLNSYKSDLLHWLVRKVKNVSEKCDVNVRDDLFSILGKELSFYSHGELSDFLNMNAKFRDYLLCRTVLENDKDLFYGTIDRTAKPRMIDRAKFFRHRHLARAPRNA